MKHSPESGRRYDKYEPEKYDCISIDDLLIESLVEKLQTVPCFWHSLDIKGNGLAYCGITLIPPQSAEVMLSCIDDVDAYRQLRELLQKAVANKLFAIHFGI